jgi:ABC-type sugar transport system ATPase subunit
MAGQLARFRGPRQAISNGLGLVTEDRQHLGLFPERPIRENVSISALELIAVLGVVQRRPEQARVQRQLDELHARMASIESRPRDLSGGNQQKVLLARMLMGRAKVLIFDEPTRGIDVAAKQEIYQLMNGLAAQGVAILMISSELPEVIGMSGRILVMRQGRVAGELARGEARPERVMELATAAP